MVSQGLISSPPCLSFSSLRAGSPAELRLSLSYPEPLLTTESLCLVLPSCNYKRGLCAPSRHIPTVPPTSQPRDQGWCHPAPLANRAGAPGWPLQVTPSLPRALSCGGASEVPVPAALLPAAPRSRTRTGPGRPGCHTVTQRSCRGADPRAVLPVCAVGQRGVISTALAGHIADYSSTLS